MFGTAGSRAGKSAAALLRSKAAAKVPLNDASARAGNAARFWNPTYFGNPAFGEVHRLNRLLVGEAALGSSDVPMTTPDWLETAFSSTTSVSQFAAVSTVGELGVTGASRTSDYRSIFGGAAGGAQGISGFVINDDTGAGNPTAAAVFGYARHLNGITGITESEINIHSAASSVPDITPHGGVLANSTMGWNITSGYAGFTSKISTALRIGPSVGTNLFRKGIVHDYQAYDTSVGVGGNGVAEELYAGQSLRWLNSSDAVLTEVWGNSTGLNVGSAINAFGTADFFGAFVAQETHTGGNGGPYFLSYRNNSAPAASDNLGAMVFQGNNDAISRTNAAGFSSRWAGSVAAGNESAALDFQTVQNGSYANRLSINAGIQIAAPTGGDKGSGTINAAGNYYANGTQVVSTRKTGWTAATGTATRTSFVTSSVTLPNLAQAVKALIDDLISHGLIGT